MNTNKIQSVKKEHYKDDAKALDKSKWRPHSLKTDRQKLFREIRILKKKLFKAQAPTVRDNHMSHTSG